MAGAERTELDVARSEKKVWLVKVPHFVAKQWHAACEASARGPAQTGVELGRVRIESSGTAAQPNCTLLLSGPTAETLPQEYNLRAATDGPSSTLHTFSEEPGHMSVVGRVDQRFDAEMRPSQLAQGAAAELDPAYRKLSRERSRAADAKTRTAQVIAPQSAAAKAKISYSQAYAQKRRIEGRGEKRVIEKRVRMDREPLESLIFRLFERQDFWNFQALVNETDQPAAWLKEVLLDLAVQSKKPGVHRDHWQLKPEYRTREPAMEEG